MSFEWLWRFAGRAAGPRDGQGLALETLDLETAPAPSLLPAMQRRKATIDRALATKLLGAHLANRHQISYPLTLDFRSMAADEADFLIDVAAAATVANGLDGSALETARSRLQRRGASAALLERMEASCATPLSINAIADEAHRRDRAAHAYAVSYMAVGARSTVGQLYLTYLAARLGLGQEIVSSVNRRYRD